MEIIRIPNLIKEEIKKLNAVTKNTKEAVKLFPDDNLLKVLLKDDQFRKSELLKELEESQVVYNLENLKKFNLKSIKKYKWIKTFSNKIEQLREVYKFFNNYGINAIQAHWDERQVAFRKSEKIQDNNFAMMLWLRKGEIEAEKINAVKFTKTKFKKALKEIRDLTVEDVSVFQTKIGAICAEAGVKFVFTREFEGVTANGATQWLDEKTPLIQLSLKYKSNDHLWFAFFHEAAHILLHDKIMFIEYAKGLEKSPEEKEADTFASNFLIPKSLLSAYMRANRRFLFNKLDVKIFAKKLGIHPGIVVGRLQRETNNYRMLNDLKQKFRWNESCGD